jgi:hypothetical protein
MTKTNRPTAFGTLNDIFYVPALLVESDITKKEDRKRVRYEVIGTLAKHSSNQTWTSDANTTPHKIAYTDNLINLIGVAIPIDEQLLRDRVHEVSCLSYSHALHLNFTNKKVKNGSIGYSPASAIQTINYLLKKLREESKRLYKLEGKGVQGSKKKIAEFQQVFGVLEFGSENMGIHSHLLIVCHRGISESWIQEQWKEEGTARLYDIGNPIPVVSIKFPAKERRDEAVKYVVSRALQYEMIPQVITSNLYGDITLVDYEGKLVIKDIQEHRKKETYHGRRKNLPRFRTTPINRLEEEK